MKIFLPLPLEEQDHIVDAEVGDPHYISPELAISDIEGFEGPYIIEIWERRVDHEASTYSSLADIRCCISPRLLQSRLVGENSDGSYEFTGPQKEILDEHDYMAEMDNLDPVDLADQMEQGLINTEVDLEVDIDDIELMAAYLTDLLVGEHIVCRKSSSFSQITWNREQSPESVKYEAILDELTPPFDKARLQVLVETTEGWIEFALLEFQPRRLYRQFEKGFSKESSSYFQNLITRSKFAI